MHQSGQALNYVTIQNKGYLIQELISNELIRRRKDQLIPQRTAILVDLNLLEKHNKVAKHVLCFKNVDLSVEQFISFIHSTPRCHAERQAYQWLVKYITASEGVKDEWFSEGKLLKFSTGLWHVPPLEKPIAIQVQFLDDDDNETQPKATSCSSILKVHILSTHRKLSNK